MDYQGDIIRPPSEANSIILQVTTGCSHNRCTFCGAYRDKQYRVKPWDVIDGDIAFAEKWCTRQKTLFLADGDALALDHGEMVRLLTSISNSLPWVRRVATYANCHNLLEKTPEQLTVYRDLGLSRLYMGLESGHEKTLRKIAKGADRAAMIEAAEKAKNAEMFLSVTCLLGIAGKEHSLDHAEDTASVLNLMKPGQIAVLTLMLLPNTPLYAQWKAGRFQQVEQVDLFRELRTMLAGLDPGRAQFQANHASNYFTLSGRLPKDKDDMLRRIDDAISGSVTIKHEVQRFL